MAEAPPVQPLELLHEADGGPAEFDLPDELRRLYGGGLGLERPCLFVNFVSTLDGVVALPGVSLSHRVIGDHNEADRVVMGLLRSCCDAILLGSGTLHGSPKSLWTAERAYPPLADEYAELRRRLGLEPEPQLVVVSITGRLDPTHPALEQGAAVLTTEAGAASLHGRLPGVAEVVTLPGTTVDMAAVRVWLEARGFGLVLSEGGPTVLGAMLASKVVDELFLTLSPLLAGRTPQGAPLALVEGIALLPDDRVAFEVASVRRDRAHLFLRYRRER
jgi:riboflavin biosynthesis pyrimidine reductase